MDIARSFTRIAIRNKRAQLCVVTSLALLAACGGSGGAEEHAPKHERPEGKVAATGQALHEESCWGPATTPHVTLDSFGQAGLWIHGSPNASYTQLACQSQWVVEVQDTSNRQLLPVGSASNIPGAPFDYCAGYWSLNRAKGWKNNAWQEIHTWGTVGAWQCAAGNCLCWEIPAPGSSLPVILPANHGYTKVRTVTQAGFAYWLSNAYAGVAMF
jgi:hypothetical protein